MESIHQKLDVRLDAVKRVFHPDTVLALHPDNAYIQNYYAVNRIPYSLFHTKTDLMHMGISRDGIWKEDDLLEAARTVETYILQLQAGAVLELATGRGANSAWLARRYPNVAFHGIDISPEQLEFAYKKACALQNYHPAFGDYHDLSHFQDEQFAVVFEVEALCHSTKKDLVISEIWRVLKNGGVCIVFDGYRAYTDDAMAPDESMLCGLVEKGMAVEEFETYDSFMQKVHALPFEIVREEDVSAHILPTLRRFERLAENFFAHPRLAKAAVRVLPEVFLLNAVSGYLMPVTVEHGLHQYMITILKKR